MITTVTMRVLVREAKRVGVRFRVSKRRRERERGEKENRRTGEQERGYLCVPKSTADCHMHFCNEQGEGGWVGTYLG